MKVVILCGGRGTRMREASEVLPKPLLPIGERPVVWHIMKSYAAGGYTDFVLCLGYRGWLLKEYFLNYRVITNDVRVSLASGAVDPLCEHADERWSVTLAETGEETQTGGRVAAVRRYLDGDELFLLTYGDGVADVDLGRLVAFHRRHGRIATVTAVRPPGRFGEMRLAGGAVREFNEKPQVTEGFVNGGYFVLDARRLWPYLEGGPELVLEREPLQRLARDGQLMAFEHPGFWQPMDTPREHALLGELWAQGRAPWKTWGRGAGGGTSCRSG